MIKAILFLTLFVVSATGIVIMKKIEPGNKFYKYYVVVILGLYLAYLFVL